MGPLANIQEQTINNEITKVKILQVNHSSVNTETITAFWLLRPYIYLLWVRGRIWWAGKPSPSPSPPPLEQPTMPASGPHRVSNMKMQPSGIHGRDLTLQ